MSAPVYTLSEAVERFLGPAWSVASLRTEIRKGRLVPMRIAGKFAVTEADIAEMLQRCRENPRDHDCISGLGRVEAAPGSSSIEDASLAQAAARMTVKALKERSRGTSSRSTSRPPAKVVSIRST